MATLEAEVFNHLAKSELEFALSKIPESSIDRFVLFTEVTRVLDYWSVFQFLLPEGHRLSEQDFQLLQWGWGVAAARLPASIAHLSGFPLIESTQQTRFFATSLLHSFGRSSLALRSAEMIRQQFLHAHDEDGEIVVKRSDHAKFQGIDQLEFDRLDRLLESWRANPPSGWTAFDPEDQERIRNRLGRFVSLQKYKQLEKYLCPNVDELMRPLIHPWNSGHGVMMGYGAHPGVDDHFLAQAAKIVFNWQEEAGFHPSIALGGVSGSDITSVVIILVSLHAKHVRFARLAMGDHKDISIPQSLTIWEPRTELLTSIVDLTGMATDVIDKALSVVSMVASDSTHLVAHTTPFSPLLYDLENGYVLRPVSSIYRNPFPAILAFQKWREPTSINQIIAPRENWMREITYALFQGNRYVRIEGAIKVRLGGVIATDIDAAIFDRTTGELALFQFKWQDFHTNDVRQLRSRASNFVGEMDSWAKKVEEWMTSVGPEILAQSLKLKKSRGEVISSVYLFGISYSVARMQGFGKRTECENLAVCNWPQFVRVRHEIGAADMVFRRMHEVIGLEMDAVAETRPMPVTLKIGGTSVRFEDLWEAVVRDGIAAE